MRLLLLAAGILCALVGLCAAVAWAALTWETEMVESAHTNPTNTSIAIDTDGHPHIAYRVNVPGIMDLRYAAWNGTSWNIETVDADGDVGGACHLALDSNDRPHISYCDSTNGDLEYAAWNGTAWDIETVDSVGFVGRSTSLALDADDHAHIAYWDDTNRDLKYAYWDGAAWQIEAVDTVGDVGYRCELALDSSDHAHICYIDADGGIPAGTHSLRYAHWTGVSWNLETLDDENVAPYISIAVDSGDHPHIAYKSNYALKHAMWNGTSWQFQTVDDSDIRRPGVPPRVALTGTGTPVIAYREHGTEKLMYAVYNGATWDIEWTGAHCRQAWLSLALDAWDYPHMAYNADHWDYTLDYTAGHSPLAVRWPR